MQSFKYSVLAVCLTSVLCLWISGASAELEFRESNREVILDDKKKARVFEDVASVVMGVSGGASLTRGNTRVRSSLKQGHVIFKGDSVNLSYNSHLSLSFDPNAYDVIQFEGPCVIAFVDTTQIELTHGKVYALLDNVKPVRVFTIKTPGAIASAKDAHFFIEVKHQGAEIHSYKSKVQVYGVTPVGDKVAPGVTVEAGRKTSISALGRLPTNPTIPLDASDIAQKTHTEKLKNIANTWMKQTKEKWGGEEFDSKSSGSGSGEYKKDENYDWTGGETKQKKLKVLY